MRNSASVSLVILVTAAIAPHAAAQTEDNEKAVKSATAEIQQLIAAATAEFQDYRQITINDEFSRPDVIVLSTSSEAAAPSTRLYERATLIGEYYRGPGETYRSEISPRITSHEGSINQEDRSFDPAFIGYRTAEGHSFNRGFKYTIAPNGDVLAKHPLRQESEDKSHTPNLFAGDLSPQFVFSMLGYRWDTYGLREIRHADTVTRTESPDRLKFEFIGRDLQENAFTLIFEFHNYGVKRLPQHYEMSKLKYNTHQDWEYVQQDGRWLPAKSTLVMGTDTPGTEKTDVVNYTFSNARAILTAEEVESDKPLTPEMDALFKKGMDLQIKKAAADTGITPSGNIVESADNASAAADTNAATGK